MPDEDDDDEIDDNRQKLKRKQLTIVVNKLGHISGLDTAIER